MVSRKKGLTLLNVWPWLLLMVMQWARGTGMRVLLSTYASSVVLELIGQLIILSQYTPLQVSAMKPQVLSESP